MTLDSPLVQAQAARAEVAAGTLRGKDLLSRISSLPALEREAWVDALLGIALPPPDAPDLPRGAVPYLPCGVEEILAVVREVPVRPDDEFVDLGAGLGRVVMLTHLLTGARAWGVEIQEHLVCEARATCADLALAGVSFIHANAADIALDGSIFFLYAPFNGAMLARVLGRLEAVARRRSVVVCAVGLEFREVPWLLPRRTSCVSLALYDSCMPGVKPGVRSQ